MSSSLGRLNCFSYSNNFIVSVVCSLSNIRSTAGLSAKSLNGLELLRAPSHCINRTPLRPFVDLRTKEPCLLSDLVTLVHREPPYAVTANFINISWKVSNTNWPLHFWLAKVYNFLSDIRHTPAIVHLSRYRLNFLQVLLDFSPQNNSVLIIMTGVS